VATDLWNLGGAWHALGEKGKAISFLEQAYAMALRLPGSGPEHETTVSIKNWLDHARASSDEGELPVAAQSPVQTKIKDKCIIM